MVYGLFKLWASRIHKLLYIFCCGFAIHLFLLPSKKFSKINGILNFL
ncbi:MAG: hypothetical protein LBI95_00880 [Holosporales bacterium]|nr:hypothetical protein [Holosporales bacterium]